MKYLLLILSVLLLGTSCTNYEELYAKKNAEVASLQQTVATLNSSLNVSKQDISRLNNEMSSLSQQIAQEKNERLVASNAYVVDESIDETMIESCINEYSSHSLGFRATSGFVLVYIEATAPGIIEFTLQNNSNNEDYNGYSFGVGGYERTKVAKSFRIYGGSYSLHMSYRVDSYGDFSPWKTIITHVPDYLDYLGDWRVPGYDYHRLSNNDKMKADVFSPSCCGGCSSCGGSNRNVIVVYPRISW